MITTTETFNAWTKSNDCKSNGISLYVENVTDLYLQFEYGGRVHDGGDEFIREVERIIGYAA